LLRESVKKENKGEMNSTTQYKRVQCAFEGGVMVGVVEATTSAKQTRAEKEGELHRRARRKRSGEEKPLKTGKKQGHPSRWAASSVAALPSFAFSLRINRRGKSLHPLPHIDHRSLPLPESDPPHIPLLFARRVWEHSSAKVDNHTPVSKEST
jgi:hypothetical protein